MPDRVGIFHLASVRRLGKLNNLAVLLTENQKSQMLSTENQKTQIRGIKHFNHLWNSHDICINHEAWTWI